MLKLHALQVTNAAKACTPPEVLEPLPAFFYENNKMLYQGAKRTKIKRIQK
jgi:hypothetical protein